MNFSLLKSDRLKFHVKEFAMTFISQRWGRLTAFLLTLFTLIPVSAIRADLIALYRFEASTTADVTNKLGAFSGNTYNGTAVGDAVSLSTDVSGVNGGSKSLSLGGSSDYITLPINAVNPFDGSQSYTITCWFKHGDLAGNNVIILSSARDTSAANHAMAFFLHNSPEGNLRTDNFFVSQNNVGSGLDDNAWHFGAVTYEPGVGFRLRVDDTYSSVSNFNPSIPNIANDTVIIGDSLNTSFPTPGDWAGLLDDVAIFNHKLTDAELDNVKAGNFSAYININPEIDVKGNGVSITSGDVTPSTADHTDFGSIITGGGYVYRTFSITNSGGSTLNLTGSPKINISGADAAHFSVVAGALSGVTVDNASFETPVQSAGGFTYGPTGTGGWVFGSEAGIARNSSPWYINAAPDGNQAAYIQSNGSGAYFYQNINFPAAGTYLVSFAIVRRNASYEGNDIDVRMDGVSIGSVSNTQQTTDTWTTFSFSYNCPSAGNHELRFVGTRATDRDSAIDRVQVDYSNVAIAAGSSASFQIKYAPLSAGTHTATVTIANNDSNEGTYTFNIQGTGVSSTTPTWSADTGNGNGTGNTTADGLRIRRNGSNIEFSADSGTTWSAAVVYSTTTALTLTGSGADDTFVIDFSGGNPIPSGGISVAGGSQVSGDKLILTGGTFATVTHNLSNATDGNLVLSGLGTVTYTGLEPVDMTGSTVADLIFNLPAGGSNAILEDEGTTANGVSRFRSSPVTFESTDFNNPTGSLTINRGNAADTLTINATPDFTASLTVGGVGTEFSSITVAGALTLAADKNLSINSSGTVNFSTSSSDVALSGTGAASITTSRDIALASGASLTTVNGNLTLSANASGATGGAFDGITVDGATIQATGSGVISVTGKGGTTASSIGINVANSGVISGGTAGTTSTVSGTGGTGSGNNQFGVVVQSSGSITTSGGNIQVTGQGGGGASSGSCYGVFGYSGGSIRATGSGTVTVNGTGGGGSGGNDGAGVAMSALGSSGTIVTSAGGNVQITGVGGGSGAATTSTGVIVADGATISAGGSGTLTITGTGGAGTGGSNFGVSITSASQGNTFITSGGGNVSITGIEGAGTGSYAINSSGGNSHSITTAVNGGTLTVSGNSMLIDSVLTISAQSGSSVTFQQYTSGVGINLGSATDTVGGPLALTNGELNRVSAGTINIGNSSSGALTISTPITRVSSTVLNLTAGSGNNISFSGTGRLDSNGGNVTLTTSGTGGIGSPGSAATDITCGALVLNSGSGGIGSISSSFQPLLINATSLTTSGPSAAQYISEADTVTVNGLNAGSSTVSLYNGTFYLTSSAVNSSTEVIVAGTLDANGSTNTFVRLRIASTGTVTGTGTITADVASPLVGTAGTITTSGALLTLGNPATSTGCNMNGTITVSSGHTLVLRDSNTATVGNTAVNGTLTAVNGVSVSSSSTVSGSGTVNAIMSVASTASVAAGNSGPGSLTSSNVTFNSGSTFVVEINGTTAGTGYDQLNVTGTINLGGATLSLSGSFTPSAGQTYTIIVNDSNDAVTGTFNGLAEGAIISNFLGSGLSAQISYVGGSGNDVVITTPTPVTWTAATANGNGVNNGTADNLWIRRNGANIEFSADNGATWPVSVIYVMTSTVTLSGSNDDDAFGIDYSGGNPIPAGGVTVTGSGQVTTGDTLKLMNGSQTTVTYTFVNDNDGSIDVDGSVITYTGLEPITDNTDAVNRVFTYNGGAERITVTGASSTQTKIDSTLGEVVTFNNPTGSMTINGGSGDDTILLYTLSSGWISTVGITVNGGAGDDVIQLNKTVAKAAPVTVNGDGHTTGDTFNFDREGDSTIVVSGASPGTITGGSTPIQTVNFDTVETINNHLYGAIGDAVIADRGPYFSTGTILLYKAGKATQQVVNTTIKDPYEIDLDGSGNFVIADYEYNAGTAGIFKISRFTGTKSTVSTNGSFTTPFGVKVDQTGGVNNGKYIVADLDADNDGSTKWGAIFVVNPATASPGNQTKLSSRSVGTGTAFYWLTGLAIGSAGDIYVCDQGDVNNPATQPPRIFHVNPSNGNRTVIAQGGTLRQPTGLTVLSGTGLTAQLLVVDAGVKRLFRFTGTGSVITPAAGDQLAHTGVTFNKPTHVTVDLDGNYIVTDAPVGASAGQHRVHRMNSSTLVTTAISTDGFLDEPRGTKTVR